MPIIRAMGFRNGFFIAVIDCATIPDPDRSGEYYPMFGLAYAYLIDTAADYR
jgi:hypothetical protein